MFKKTLDIKKAISKEKNRGISLRMRLLVFFVVFLIAVISGFLLIFSITGKFNAKKNEYKQWTQNQLNLFSENIYNDFGRLSIQGIEFSQLISTTLENDMRKLGVLPSQLQNNPEKIEIILNSHIDDLVSKLKQAKASGIFLILDATVNPKLSGSANSRAGIFLKCAEPNILNSNDLSISYLRGPAHIAISEKIKLLPQWKMEFEISENDFFNKTIQTAKQSKLPVSRLYYWSERMTLKDNSESAMLICVPLIGSDGTVFGICGFEVSTMLFKLEYSSPNNLYNRVFSTLALQEDDFLYPNKGLIAGNYYLTNSLCTGEMKVTNDPDGFKTFQSENSDNYLGLSVPIKLYPENSAFSDQKWIFSIMLPKEDISSISKEENQKIIIAIIILFILSIIFADLISRRYIRPVHKALNSIKSNGYSSTKKTRIHEIDDLIAFLAAEDEKSEKNTENTNNNNNSDTIPNTQQYSFSAYQEFVNNIALLSAAEKAVFNLYMLGHSANEITDILCLSINTIKTHNRRIYTKLNITSRKELMVYVNMMKEAETAGKSTV